MTLICDFAKLASPRRCCMPDEQDGELHVRGLYEVLIDCWNRRSAEDFAACFAEQGSIVGFDGSQVNGASNIAAHLAPIFADHPTPTYVTLVEGVRTVAPGAVILRAVSGLLPPGQDDIVPELNAVQTLVAARNAESWQVELFQNTPAQFHGQPELAGRMTADLREALRNRRLEIRRAASGATRA